MVNEGLRLAKGPQDKNKTKLTLQDLESRRTSGSKPIYFSKGDFYNEPQSSSEEENNNPRDDSHSEKRREVQQKEQRVQDPTFSGIPATTPWANQAYRNVRTPSTIMWGDMGTTEGGLNINIQPAQKPRKLQELNYQSVRAFQAEFRLYHLESKGQATLHGHISEKMVTVIGSLLGVLKSSYKRLLIIKLQ